MQSIMGLANLTMTGKLQKASIVKRLDKKGSGDQLKRAAA
jgi:hypothetical protein